jgi:hypothetical protein
MKIKLLITVVSIFSIIRNIYVTTTEDGNCLFHAVSNSIYGNDTQSFNLKFCSAFIVYQNQQFFQQVLQADGNTTPIPDLMIKMLKLGKWQDRTTLVALNILLGRPIYSFCDSIGTSHETNILPKTDDIRSQYPINILFHVNHFMGLLGIKDKIMLPFPPNKSNRFWKFSY